MMEANWWFMVSSLFSLATCYSCAVVNIVNNKGVAGLNPGQAMF